MEKSLREELLGAALEARWMAYCPYSGFAVGAAVLCGSGEIFTGCNVENASYGATICAERVALTKAISQGELSFRAIAVAGGPAGERPQPGCRPCGICRQTLAEFSDENMAIYMVQSLDSYEVTELGKLLPLAFGKDNLT